MKKLLLIAACAAAMVACSQSKQTEAPIVEERIPIKISTNISRANDYGFEYGDRVGIYVSHYYESSEGWNPGYLQSSGNYVDNMGFGYDGAGTWTPDEPIYWFDKSTPVDFYCYYPFAYGVDVYNHQFYTQQDQSSLDNYKASDFLWGKSEQIYPTADAVGIQVNHLFSNALISLVPGKGFTQEDLNNASISVRICNVCTEANINLNDGTASATGYPCDVTPYNEGSYYRALIVPQTVYGGSGLIIVNINNVDYTLKREQFTFKANKQHKFTITVNKINNGINIGIGGWDSDGEDYGGDAE